MAVAHKMVAQSMQDTHSAKPTNTQHVFAQLVNRIILSSGSTSMLMKKKSYSSNISCFLISR